MNVQELELKKIMRKMDQKTKERIESDFDAVILAKPKNYLIYIGLLIFVFFLFITLFYVQMIYYNDFFPEKYAIMNYMIMIIFAWAPILCFLASIYAILKRVNERIIITKEGVIKRSIFNGYTFIAYNGITEITRNKYFEKSYIIKKEKKKIKVNTFYYDKNLSSLFIILFSKGVITRKTIMEN